MELYDLKIEVKELCDGNDYGHMPTNSDLPNLIIDPIMILEGGLSRKTRSQVFEWAAIHQAELRANWELARAGLPLRSIAPLD